MATGRFETSEALALYCWPYFLLGVAVNWAHHGRVRPEMLSFLLVTIFVTLALVEDNHHFTAIEVAFAVVTATLIYIVSRAGRLTTLTLGPMLQSLGRISDSLYLVGTPGTRLGIRLLGRQPGALEAIALVLISTALSTGAAQIMYGVVERPAMRLSQRLRAKRTDGQQFLDTNSDEPTF